MIFLLLLALCVPSLVQALPFIDVEHETGETAFFYAPNFGSADSTTSAFSYATNRFFSGTGAVRLNYGPNCQTLTTANQCGGSTSYTFPTLLSTVFWRQYVFITGSAAFGATNITSDGKFHVANAWTKMLKIQSNGGSAPPRTWMTMGTSGSKNLVYHLENNPYVGGVRTIPTNVTVQDNRWYCLEGQLTMNTPGQSNGIVNLWVDNNFAGGASNVLFIYGSIPATAQWEHASLFRQIGEGNIFYDRTAFSTSRIGCVGSPPVQDTTNPNPPTNLTAQ